MEFFRSIKCILTHHDWWVNWKKRWGVEEYTPYGVCSRCGKIRDLTLDEREFHKDIKLDEKADS